uniref:Uncharacterized protein n=1 Tax=Salix viminalis TaxID=40686 RepID=A0A6N2M0N9_SALVM
MSFAAVVAQICNYGIQMSYKHLEVLERKDAAGERMSVDHLSMICTSAVRESLANVSQILTAHSSIDSGFTSQSFLMYLSTSDRPQNADLI